MQKWLIVLLCIMAVFQSGCSTQTTTENLATTAYQESLEHIKAGYTVWDWTSEDKTVVEYDGAIPEEELEKAKMALYEWMLSGASTLYDTPLPDYTVSMQLPILIPTTKLPLVHMTTYIDEKYSLNGHDDRIAFIAGPDHHPGYILVKEPTSEQWKIVYWGTHFGEEIQKPETLPAITDEEFNKIKSLAKEKLYAWIEGTESAPIQNFDSVFRLNYRLLDETTFETIAFRQTSIKCTDAALEQEIDRLFNIKPEEGVTCCIEIDEGGWAAYFTFFKKNNSEDWFILDRLCGNFYGS